MNRLLRDGPPQRRYQLVSEDGHGRLVPVTDENADQTNEENANDDQDPDRAN